MGDDEDWDDFTPQEAGPSQPAVQEPEPEPEPEPDPVAEAFADMGMEPVITKTKRHLASNPWAERGPVSSSLAMAMDDDGGGAGWEDAGDTLDLRAERRKQAEERVARNSSGRAQKTTAAQKSSRLAAVRAPHQI